MWPTFTLIRVSPNCHSSLILMDLFSYSLPLCRELLTRVTSQRKKKKTQQNKHGYRSYSPFWSDSLLRSLGPSFLDEWGRSFTFLNLTSDEWCVTDVTNRGTEEPFTSFLTFYASNIITYLVSWIRLRNVHVEFLDPFTVRIRNDWSAQ